MRLETDKIRQAIRLLNLKYSQREIAKQINVSRDTIRVLFGKLKLFPIDNRKLNSYTNQELLHHFEISRILN